MEKQKSIDKMGTAPVGKLILTTGIPMIISMILQALYNIVDSAFVSNARFPDTDADGGHKHRDRGRRKRSII